MKHPREYLPALDRIESALEASCGALIALESITCRLADHASERDGVQEHVGRAIRSLREAIDELRSAQNDGAHVLAMGFVLNGSGSAARDPAFAPGQSNPWRTA